MLDITLLRTEPDIIRRAMEVKGIGSPSLVDEVIEIDQAWRAAQTQLEEAQRELNSASKEIGRLFGTGQKEEAQAMIKRSGELKQTVSDLGDSAGALSTKRDRLMLELPNIPHESVPIGASPADNVVAFEWGEKRTFAFEAKPHWELIDQHGLVSFEQGAKVTGAGFPFYLGAGAKLQRALINYFLDQAGERGYMEVQPPIVVNADSATATGQLPDKEDMMYEVVRDGLYLIPTAEVPVTNYLRAEILDHEQLPIQYAAYSPCFRREAGSYGKDVRGLNRLHQFDKVELVMYVHPSDSYAAIERLREDAERLIQALGLAYRRLSMCTADMGFTQSKKYDLEVWSPGQERWLEVSSVSNFEAFQARRADIRFRPDGGGRPEFVHTLNGSGLALPRIVAALLETHQQKDGSVAIPEPLQPYFGGEVLGG